MTSFLTALLIAVPAGALFSALDSPLPWVIGPMLCCAAASMLGARLSCPVAARHGGQWMIGTALGLYFTPPVVAFLAALAPWVAAAVLWSILLGLATAWALRRFAGVSLETAFFAGAIGGAHEMTAQGERAGGRVDQIAAAHALRIMLVVTLVPFAFRFLDLHGSDPYESAGRAIDYGGLAALVALTVAAGFAMQRLGGPNAWIMGPMIASTVLTATGHEWSGLPQWLVVTGQIMLGTALGVRFERDFFTRAPHYVLVAGIVTVVAIGVSAAFGGLLGWAAGIPAATMVLATSPGGIAEITLTAKNLRLGVPVVTVFQVTRMVMSVLLIGLVFRLVCQARRWQARA